MHVWKWNQCQGCAQGWPIVQALGGPQAGAAAHTGQPVVIHPSVLRHYLCIAAALSRGLPPPSHQPSTPLGVLVDLKCSLLLKIYDTAPIVSCKPLLSFSLVILQVTSQKSCQWILNTSAGMPKSDIKQRKWKTNLGENTPHYWVSGWQTQSCFGSDPHCQFLNEIPNHKECYSAPKLPGSHCWSTSTHATPWHNCCWHSEWQTQLALVGQLSKNG